MGLSTTPASSRVHIGIFGRRNAGKSSVINALTGQNLAVVSDVKGTTTDPVYKAMELLPMGPVMLIDTPGIDDYGSLGEKRVEKSYQVLRKTDVAVLVIDSADGVTADDERIAGKVLAMEIPLVAVYNKSDLSPSPLPGKFSNEIAVSAKANENITALKELIAKQLTEHKHPFPIISDLIKAGDIVVLVIPIDSSAPKGRLILPQQQTIRDILDCGACALSCGVGELSDVLRTLGEKVSLVVTDSQAFKTVGEIVPQSVPLTSFSILFARHNGNLQTALAGCRAIDGLKDGDKVLIAEGCTHHRQCEDIGTVKIPAWVKKHTGKNIDFEFTSGVQFPDDLSKYALVIHCGGCMLNEKEMKYRMNCGVNQSVPFTNYGTAIAHMNGILERSVRPLLK